MFDKIIGYEDIKEEFIKLLDQIKHPDKYKAMGADMVSAILLDGNPGCGKSTLCRNLIEEAAINSYIITKDCSEESMIERLNQTFDDALKNAPAIVLLDDIDKYADVSAKDYDCNREIYCIIQSLLDKVKDSGVIVLATSNRGAALPDSLKRSGRFNVIRVPQPKQTDIRHILDYYLKDKNVADDINTDDLARLLGGSAVSDLEEVLRSAATDAVYYDEASINMRRIVETALKREHPNPFVREAKQDDLAEISRTAMHEAGHLLISLVYEPNSIGYVALFPRSDGSCEGLFTQVQRPDRRPYSILIGLAGKTASELFYPKCAAGCSGDIDSVTGDIREGLTENALYGFGFVNPDEYSHNGPSDYLRAAQEAVIASELQRYTHLCREVLMKNKDLLKRFADELTEQRVLLYSNIMNIASQFELVKVEV